MNDKTYWIVDDNEPNCLWAVNKKVKDEEGAVYYPSTNKWERSICAFNDLDGGDVARRITKREARSLFPLAFPPHTKE